MKNTALFPSMIFKDYNNIIIKRRLAWCYGDLDIAISLWHAGNALNNQIWKNKSLQIFRSCIELVEEQDLLTEFGICHGTSGIAMIFRRIYLETEELLFIKLIFLNVFNSHFLEYLVIVLTSTILLLQVS